jgi:hypothetical protein
MKKLLYIFYIAALTPFLTGCFEDPGTDILLEQQFVSYYQTSTNIQENGEGGTIRIDVAQGAPSDVNIELSVETSNLVQGVDFTLPQGTSYTIPSGEYSIEIPFTIVDNQVFSPGVLSFTLGIESVSGGIEILADYGSHTVTVIENDCEFFPEDWVGTYTVDEAFTGGVNAPSGFSDFFGESYQVEMAIDPTDPTGTTAILTNSEGFDQYFIDGTLLKFNTCDLNVGFPGGDPNVADFTNIAVESSSFDPDALTIRVDGDSGGFGPYGFTLTKQ